MPRPASSSRPRPSVPVRTASSVPTAPRSRATSRRFLVHRCRRRARSRLLRAPRPGAGLVVGGVRSAGRRARHRRPARIEAGAAGDRRARAHLRRDVAALGQPMGPRDPLRNPRRRHRGHSCIRRLGRRIPRRRARRRHPRTHRRSGCRGRERPGGCSSSWRRSARASSCGRRARHPLSSRCAGTCAGLSGCPPRQAQLSGYWRRGTVAFDHHAPIDPFDPDE